MVCPSRELFSPRCQDDDCCYRSRFIVRKSFRADGNAAVGAKCRISLEDMTPDKVIMLKIWKDNDVESLGFLPPVLLPSTIYLEAAHCSGFNLPRQPLSPLAQWKKGKMKRKGKKKRGEKFPD
ncbi:hypothetical protein CEXT_33961 [Caerostris extrusa]|uniref:Uncharacterized protein n=1 Tax=Caerostris extrusa TaxID=172846 RepID=A0AAV4N3B3_CAEEX|nr:hypothetical protein CEXT_33961 [Caerostris extrusa]